jgi:hypothetical protein
MGINIRAKGQNGEREIVDLLEPIVQRLLREGGYPIPDKPVIQRNQNQSAVGGSDLSNTFGMAIEIKRQEQLSVNTWWAQCVKAANTLNEHPVLLYRQNNKKWRCVTLAWVQLPKGELVQVRAEFTVEEFLVWFAKWVEQKLLDNAC